MTAATIAPVLDPPCCSGAEVVVAPAVVVVRGVVVVLVVVGEVVVDAEVDGAEKATTLSAAGARRSPAPTDGVGKWLAGTPTLACSWTAPVVGLRP